MKKKYISWAAVIVLAVSGLAFGQVNYPMYQWVYFGAPGGNDADITLQRNPSVLNELQMLFTTSDTETFVFSSTQMEVNDNIYIAFGTAGAESTLRSNGTVTGWDLNNGALRIGDGGSSNYTSFAQDTGAVTFAGTARPTFEIFVPSQSLILHAGTPAIGAIGGAVPWAWALDAASDESVAGMFKVPDGFAAANATCYIGWSTTATTEAQAVYFDVVTVPVANGEDSGVAGNTDTGNAALGATAAADELHELSVTVAASTEWAANDIVYFYINRDADNASDTIAADVSIHYFRCTGTATDIQ